MSYTRYEYRKSSKFKPLCSVIIIATISIVGGFYISKFIFKGTQIYDNKNSSYSVEENSKISSGNFIALQCGYFSKQENAQAELIKIPSECQSFIVEEDGKYRVLAGIYKEEEALKKMEELTSKGLEIRKFDLVSTSNSIENKKKMQIIDGFFKIVNKLKESEVKSIKTSEYKAWAETIIKSDETLAKLEETDALINYVKQLPEELDKENIIDNMKKLYEILKNIK